MMAAYKNLALTACIGLLLPGAHCSFAQIKRTESDSSSANALRSQIPEWAPVYPATVPSNIQSKPGAIEHYFNFELITHDPCPKVIDWYEQKLIASGYKTFARFDYNDGGCRSLVRSDSADRRRSVNVTASKRVNDVAISVESVERGGGGNSVGLPSWIPIYRGSKLEDVEVSKESTGTHYHFSFTSRDDSAAVYQWYESQLSRLAFRCTSKTAPNSAGSFEGTASGRTFAIRNFPTPPEYAFVVDVTVR